MTGWDMLRVWGMTYQPGSSTKVSIECPVSTSVWGMTYQPGSSTKVSIECPVSTSHWFLVLVCNVPSDLRGRARTGQLSVRITWLVETCSVSGAWHISQAALQRWALNAVSQPDTIIQQSKMTQPHTHNAKEQIRRVFYDKRIIFISCS